MLVLCRLACASARVESSRFVKLCHGGEFFLCALSPDLDVSLHVRCYAAAVCALVEVHLLYAYFSALPEFPFDDDAFPAPSSTTFFGSLGSLSCIFACCSKLSPLLNRFPH